jgi:hypothetical protein
MARVAHNDIETGEEHNWGAASSVFPVAEPKVIAHGK